MDCFNSNKPGQIFGNDLTTEYSYGQPRTNAKLAMGLKDSLDFYQFTSTDLTFEDIIFMTDLRPEQALRYQQASRIQRDCFRLDFIYPKVQAQLQIGGSYNPLNLVSNANECLANFAGVGQTANEMLKGVTDVLDQIKTFLFGADETGVLNKLCLVIVNACLAGKNFIVSLLFNVAMHFGSKILAKISAFFQRRDTEAIPADLQINDGFIAGVASTIQNNFGLCAATLGALLAVLLQLVLGLPNFQTVDQALKFFGERGRNLKGIVDFHKVSLPMFTSVGEYLLTSCFGKVRTDDELDQYLVGYADWSARVMNLVQMDPPFATRIEKDKTLVFECDKLYRQSVEYACLLGQKKLHPEMTLHFQKVSKIVEEMRRMCDNTGVFGNRPRTKPLVVHLFGESGVGKSGMTWPLAEDLNAALSSDLATAKDFAREIYFRNTEQEFWDGYCGQQVVVYDDFGQRADSQAAPNEEFMEIIRAANLAPYPLHMADLAEKRRTKFCSKALILTSNVLEQKVNSLTFPDAYRRRVDVCAKVDIKTEYSKTGYSKATGAAVLRLDRTKCDGPVDTAPYLLELYDAENQQPLLDEEGAPIKMDYDEFLEHCVKVLKRSYEDSQLMNNKLESRINQDRFNKIRAMMQANYTVSYSKESEEVKIIKQALTGAEGFDRKKWTDTIMTSLDHTLRDAFASIKKWMESVFTLKNSLIMIGLALAGLGVWKWISRSSDKKPHQPRQRTSPADVATEGNPSGDPNTIRKPILVTEAVTSGDPNTLRNKQVATEAVTSGDPNTLTNKRVTVEATTSGDPNTVKRPIVTTEAEPSDVQPVLKTESSVSGDPRTVKNMRVYTEGETPAELQAWADSTAQDLITHRILSNLYKISKKEPNGEVTTLLNGLFVRDNVMLVPRHLLGHISTMDEIIIENMTNSRFPVPFRDCQVAEIKSSQNTDKDACLIKFPAYVNSHTDLVKHFQTMPELSLRRANVCLPTIREVRGQKMLLLLGNTQARFDAICLETSEGILNIRDSLVYSLNTISGDCGAPVIAQETSMLRKICGIHIAGARDGSAAFGQSVTRADLERTLQEFKGVVITDADTLPNFTKVSTDLQIDKEYSSDDIKSLLGLAADTFFFLGGCSQGIFSPQTSDILKSPLHGVYKEPVTKPAHLKHKEVNIMHKNLEKCGVNTPYIPKREVERAVNEVTAKLLTGREKIFQRVLTIGEAVQGSEVSDFLCPINRASSAGYPWVLERKNGYHGKTQWLGSTDYVIADEVREAVEKRIELAKQGIRAPTVWTDTLKDERRPIAKVDALKTRVFAHGPMDYTIAFRMYFLSFMAHVMENRIGNEQSIGTNPFGYDWTRTAKKLMEKGKKVFAGDFSTFDGTLNSCIMSAFVDVINKFYDDGEENARIREVLFKDVYNSIHLCQGKFYGTTHSQPSGNPITTVLNSFYNSVSMRIAYYRCAEMAGIKRPPEFDVAVSMVSYGDDNVINFADSVVSWFNQVTATKAFASFGMTYTDEAKTGEIVEYRALTDVAYLKRSFRFDGYFWRAPLDLDVILETPQWVRKCPDELDACIMNTEACVRELAQHSRETFDKWAPVLTNELYKATAIYPKVQSYDQYVREWNEEMI